MGLSARLRAAAIRERRYTETNEEAAALLVEAADTLDQLTEALRFYADPDNWGPGGWIEGELDDGYPGDLGRRARAALDEAGCRGSQGDTPE